MGRSERTQVAQMGGSEGFDSTVAGWIERPAETTGRRAVGSRLVSPYPWVGRSLRSVCTRKSTGHFASFSAEVCFSGRTTRPLVTDRPPHLRRFSTMG